MHSPLSIVRLPNWHRSHEIVRLAPEKTRSGSADMAGIERISTAIRERRGSRASRSYSSRRRISSLSCGVVYYCRTVRRALICKLIILIEYSPRSCNAAP
ncbi:hypothetical protein HZ326_30851 [Fusarium oxysporum f. sp. albedinis]|nr:hypothetical protein HZ326_30851 [Fusarium oxysporum f. sp. albedinis]